MDVRIYANSRQTVCDRDDEIGRLATDPRQREQSIDAVGNAASEVALQNAGDLDEPLRLGSVESDRIDRTSDVRDGRGRQSRDVGCDREQSSRSRGGHAVLRAQTENAARKHSIGVTLGFGDERRDRGIDGTTKIAKRAHHARKVPIRDTARHGPLHELHVKVGPELFKRPRLAHRGVDDPGEGPVWCATMRLRTGLVGVGKHGLRYAKHIRDDVPGLRLDAVCRRERQTGEQIASSYGCEYVADARTLAARDDIDLIVIAAAPAVIEEVVSIALAHKKRLLIEKPVAPDLATGLRILVEVERSGAYCAAGQTLRLNTVTKAMGCRVAELGRLDSMIFSQRFPPQLDLAWLDDPTQSGGGNILHTGVHCFDLCRLLAHAEPQAVFCTARSVYTRRTEDVFASCIEMSDGSFATVSCSRTTHSRNGLIEVTGEWGQLVGDHVLNTLYRLGPQGRQEIPLPPPTHTVLELLRVVADDCRADRPPTIPYRDGLAAVAVADACYRSIASGRKERVVMPASGP